MASKGSQQHGEGLGSPPLVGMAWKPLSYGLGRGGSLWLVGSGGGGFAVPQS